MSENENQKVIENEKVKKVYERPYSLSGGTAKVKTVCPLFDEDKKGVDEGRMYLTLNRDEADGKLREVIARWSHEAGTCKGAWIEALSRVICVALQEGVSLEKLRDAMRRIRCPGRTAGHFDATGHPSISCIDALAVELERFLGGGEK